MNQTVDFGCLPKDLITDMIGSRLSLAIGKDLGFGMFKVGTTLEKNRLNVRVPRLLDMVSLSSMRLLFSHFHEFWVKHGGTFPQKLLLSVFFLV